MGTQNENSRVIDIDGEIGNDGGIGTGNDGGNPDNSTRRRGRPRRTENAEPFISSTNDEAVKEKTPRGSNATVDKRSKEWANNLSMMMGAFDTYRKGQINLKLSRINLGPIPPESNIWGKSVAECQTVCDPASKLYDKLPRDARKRIDEISTPVALFVATVLFVKGSLDIEFTISNEIKNATRQFNAGFGIPNNGSVEQNPNQNNGGFSNSSATGFTNSFSAD